MFLLRLHGSHREAESVVAVRIRPGEAANGFTCMLSVDSSVSWRLLVGTSSS